MQVSSSLFYKTCKENFMTNMKARAVWIKNNFDGYYSLELPDYRGISQMTRKFIMLEQGALVAIPMEYALSIFMAPHARNAWRAGFFSFEKNVDSLLEEAYDEGLLTSEEAATVLKGFLDKDAIVAILKDGDNAKIDDLFNGPNKSRAFFAAQSVADELTNTVVNQVEQLTGLAIRLRD